MLWRWRPSWRDPKAKPPDHGKREVPTAIFALRAKAPARMAYVIYPYPRGQKPSVGVRDMGDLRFNVSLPDGSVDVLRVRDGVEVVRTPKGGEPQQIGRLTP